ncbi:class I SAM-dependent methyltransferase [Pseudidiomarina salilacus]|uniref:class I SAM-dependent methyltransferase n=1 Tax=Pseudidiomarina salilacus TaxID=3384452 RepID=UPI003984CBA2
MTTKTTTKSYQEHFEQRGTAYERAMQAYPHARDEEFLQVLNTSRNILTNPQQLKVADVPAGGGYLQRYLPPNCIWLGHEPCASFMHHAIANHANSPETTDVPLLPLPWQDQTIDVAISVAGLHHLEDKTPLFKELHRVLKSNGELIISDVATGSNVATFLDTYVGANNSTGHEGIYLDERTKQELRQANFTITAHKHNHFYWKFNNIQEMAEFCHQLFDLELSTAKDTQEAIERYLGVAAIAHNQVGMRWSLTTIRAIPNYES